jgi:hypothetical protein
VSSGGVARANRAIYPSVAVFRVEVKPKLPGELDCSGEIGSTARASDTDNNSDSG